MAAAVAAPAGAPAGEWHVRPPNAKNPIVFFDVTIGSLAAGRVKMELFADIVPKTAENFRWVICKWYSMRKKIIANASLLSCARAYSMVFGTILYILSNSCWELMK